MKTGRPSELTPENYAKLVEYITGGVPYEMASGAIGINKETIYHWLNLGKRDLEAGINSEFAKFSNELKDIACKNALDNLKNVKSLTNRWQAAAWLLERHPITREHFATVTENRINELENSVKKSVEEIKDAQKKYEQPI
jgi:trehalose-6-phosphate synthase